MSKWKGPELPELIIEENLFARAETARDTDAPISEIRLEGLCARDSDLSGLHFSGVLFRGCRLAGTDFQGSSFTDVIFRDCDLSGCDFGDGYFSRCLLEDCKGTGTGFSEIRVHQMIFQGGNYRYMAVSRAKLTDMRFVGCDLSDGDFTECALKNTAFQEVRMEGASFFKTPLKGIDLTGCRISGLRVSAGCPELRGAVVDLFQAAELAKLLGLVIK